MRTHKQVKDVTVVDETEAELVTLNILSPGLNDGHTEVGES